MLPQPDQGRVIPTDARADDHPRAVPQERLKTFWCKGLAQLHRDPFAAEVLGLALMVSPLAAFQHQNVGSPPGQ